MSNYNVNLTDITDTRQVNVNVTTGDKGWSAELVMVRRESDGALVALREWVGGSGEKPTPPQYVAEDGFTDDIEEAVNFKGEKGDKPNHEWIGYSLRFELPNGDWGTATDLRGEKGEQGEQGEQGFTPYVGDNGNWWIDDQDLGFSPDAYIAINSTSLPTPVTSNNFSLVTEGTYTRSGQSNVVVPEGQMGVLVWNGAVWSLGSTMELPQAENKILDWEAGTYVQGDQRIHNGQIWSVDVPSTTEEPGTGTDWKPAIDTVQKDLLFVNEDDGNQGKPFVVTAGRYIRGSDGEEVVNANFDYITLDVDSDIMFMESNFAGIPGGNFGAYFDSEGVYIRSIDVVSKALQNSELTKRVMIPPENASVVKISILRDHGSSTRIYDGEYFVASTEQKIKPELIDYGFISERDISPSTANYLKLNNYKTFADFCYIRFSQVLGAEVVSSSTLSSTNLIPIKEGETIKVRNYLDTISPSALSSRGVFLDPNKKLVGSVPMIDSVSPEYLAPEDGFVTLIFEKSMADELFVSVSGDISLKIPLSSIDPPIAPQINRWDGKRWTSFGDSITFGNVWQPYVVSALGMVHTNLGIGSTCMINAGTTPMSSDGRIDDVIASDPDVVTILAGANDLVYIEGGTSAVAGANIGDSSEFDKPLASKNKLMFYGAYSYLIERLLTWKPTLRIFILGTTWAHNGGSTLNSLHTYKEFADASKEIAIHYGLTYVDTYSNIGFNKFTLGNSPNNVYSTDEIHPNDAGGRRMATVVISKLKENQPI